MTKTCTIFWLSLFLALSFTSVSLAGGYAIVTEVTPVTTKITTQTSVEKGTSGLGAGGGGAAGAWAGFKWGGVPGALVGAGVGALGGNSLEKGIRDKKTNTTTEEKTVSGFSIKLNNGASFFSDRRYRVGQRISLDNIGK